MPKANSLRLVPEATDVVFCCDKHSLFLLNVERQSCQTKMAFKVKFRNQLSSGNEIK